MVEEILRVSSTFNEIKDVWDCVKDVVYDSSEQSNNINLKEKGGINYYYLGDIKEEKIKQIDHLTPSLFLAGSSTATPKRFWQSPTSRRGCSARLGKAGGWPQYVPEQ